MFICSQTGFWPIHTVLVSLASKLGRGGSRMLSTSYFLDEGIASGFGADTPWSKLASEIKIPGREFHSLINKSASLK